MPKEAYLISGKEETKRVRIGTNSHGVASSASLAANIQDMMSIAAQVQCSASTVAASAGCPFSTDVTTTALGHCERFRQVHNARFIC